MRSFLHHNFCRLVKWLSSFCQKKNTPERTPITAEKLQEICNPFHSSLKEDGKSIFRRALTCIKTSGLEENIILKTISDSPSSEPKINGVTFRNLKIKGEVKISFSHLETIEFLNNEFSDNVTIALQGVTSKNSLNTKAIFNRNNFSKSFDINCTHTIFEIENNDISRKMRISFSFTSLFNDPDYRKTKNTFLSATVARLFMDFSTNKINYLTINDISDLSKWNLQDHDYPLEIIQFSGNNRIRVMTIYTKHTMLAPFAQLKADVNRISFNASDKIGVSTPKTVPTDNDVEFLALFLRDNYQLIYGRFFSLLEKQASEQRDRVNEDIYKRKARYFYRIFLPQWQDKFIFIWTNLVSRDGTSWARPIICLVITEMIFAAIAWGSLVEWGLHHSWQEGGKVFLTLLTWFMNPASLLPLPLTLDPKTIANSWLIYLLFLLQKASVAVFYYEIIKVLRRFTK